MNVQEGFIFSLREKRPRGIKMSEKKIFQVPGYLVGFKTMANHWRINVDVQETVPGAHIENLVKMKDKLGYFTFSLNVLEPEVLLDLPPLTKIEKADKTPSQRLRGVFYVMWQQNSEGYETADEHYKVKMEQLINYYKDKLSD